MNFAASRLSTRTRSLIRSEMASVNKFFVASMCLLAAPLAVLYGYKNKLLPGSTDLPPEAMTLWTGILAVIAVNVVIAFFIYMAVKEPSDKREKQD